MYQSETTAAVVLATELLSRNGYPHAWGFRGALARIARFDASHGAWNLGSVQDHWPWLINRRLGTNYPTVPARYGRSFGYTDWLYGRRSGNGGNGPVATARPTQPAPPAKPKQTTAPVGDRFGTASSSGGGQADGPPVADEPTPSSKSSAAGLGPSGRPTAEADTDGAATSTPGGTIWSSFRQLVVAGLLVALILSATARIVRARARPRADRGHPSALGRPG